MSDHTRALVPVGTGLFASPELEAADSAVDIGLLMEALIYYDHVLVNFENQKQFGAFINWFLERNSLGRLFELFEDGTLQIYNRAFRTNPFVDGNNVELINIVEQVENEPDSFVKRYLSHEEVTRRFPRRRQLYELRRLLQGRVLENRVEEFGREGLANAERDFLNPRRCRLLLQEVINEIFRVRSLGTAPKVDAQIIPLDEAESSVQVVWNIDFEALSRQVGLRLAFGPTIALSGAVIGNQHIWSAERLGCDLFLPSPISSIVGDKLYEANQTVAKTGVAIDSIISELEVEVEFPDVRSLINTNRLTLKDILRIRRKAKRFRQWLQDEGERDRNALFAYHFEVAKEAGLTRAGRKVLRLFGVLGAPIGGTAVATAVGQHPLIGTVAGAAVSAGLEYVFDLGSKIGEEWRPVVFGKWYKNEIDKLLRKN